MAAAASLEQIEHRLQLMATPGPLTVIDDSYNANPVGVHSGLDVLAAMPGHKFLITPGLVELGSVEDEENRRYGVHAARVCDHVIVMSAKTSFALCAASAKVASPRITSMSSTRSTRQPHCSSACHSPAMSSSSPTIFRTPICPPYVGRTTRPVTAAIPGG